MLFDRHRSSLFLGERSCNFPSKRPIFFFFLLFFFLSRSLRLFLPLTGCHAPFSRDVSPPPAADCPFFLLQRAASSLPFFFFFLPVTLQHLHVFFFLAAADFPSAGLNPSAGTSGFLCNNIPFPAPPSPDCVLPRPRAERCFLLPESCCLTLFFSVTMLLLFFPPRHGGSVDFPLRRGRWPFFFIHGIGSSSRQFPPPKLALVLQNKLAGGAVLSGGVSFFKERFSWLLFFLSLFDAILPPRQRVSGVSFFPQFFSAIEIPSCRRPPPPGGVELFSQVPLSPKKRIFFPGSGPSHPFPFLRFFFSQT